MISVPPFRGEFGIMLRFHACAVRAMPRPVLVAHEEGLEALYPDCKRIIVPTNDDSLRRWTYAHDDSFVNNWKERMGNHTVMMPDKDKPLPIQPFTPVPVRKQLCEGCEYDVVICPRKRAYGSNKNWDAWHHVTDVLKALGLRVFAAGLEETSYPVDAHARAWDYPRPLDATIQAMSQSKVVLATASGLSLLALLVGKPLVLVAANEGRVAPGPVADLAGKVHHDTYWRVPIASYYRPLNHKNVTIDMISGAWENPGAAIHVVREMVA